MAELTDINGIGPSKAETLEGEGYETVEDLAEADHDELAAVKGVGDDRALEFIVGASDLVEDSEDDSEDEGDDFDLTPAEVGEEVEPEPEPETETRPEPEVEEEEDDEPLYERYSVVIDFETRLQYHTFHAAIMRYHERVYTSNQPKSDAMQMILDGLTESGEIVYELEEEQFNTLHTAVKQLRTNYQGDNLIDHMEALAAVEEQINEQRREYLF